jgi:hypothetical protein
VLASCCKKGSSATAATRRRRWGSTSEGLDRANWGKTTRSYINRVMVGLQKEQPAQLSANASTFDRVQASMQPAIPPDAIARVLQAYQSGQMTPQERSDFESDVKAGKVMLPKGESLQAADPAAATSPTAAGNVLPQGVLNAYYDGKMTPQEKAQLQSDVASGLVKLPKGVQLEAGALSQVPRVLRRFRGRTDSRWCNRPRRSRAWGKRSSVQARRACPPSPA